MAGSLLSSIAGGFIGSMIAQQFFHDHSASSDISGNDLSQELGSTETQDTAANAGSDLEDAGHDLIAHCWVRRQD